MVTERKLYTVEYENKSRITDVFENALVLQLPVERTSSIGVEQIGSFDYLMSLVVNWERILVESVFHRRDGREKSNNTDSVVWV